ncbi:hypothetical protein D3C76_1107680 [compost metagenome]
MGILGGSIHAGKYRPKSHLLGHHTILGRGEGFPVLGNHPRRAPQVTRNDDPQATRIGQLFDYTFRRQRTACQILRKQTALRPGCNVLEQRTFSRGTTAVIGDQGVFSRG